jgi:hypothetical protein
MTIKMTAKRILPAVFLLIIFCLSSCRTLIYPVRVARDTFILNDETIGERVVTVTVFKQDALSELSQPVWQIEAEDDVPVKGFKVTVGDIPEGFRQLIPEQTRRLELENGRGYRIAITVAPVDDSVKFMYAPWIAGLTEFGALEVKVDGTYIHKATGMVFPEKVGLFKREDKILQYDPDASNIGVGYNLDDIGHSVPVTVYIYPAGEAKAPCDKAFNDHFDQIKSAVVSRIPHARLLLESDTEIRQTGKTVKGRVVKFVYDMQTPLGAEQALTRAYLFINGKWFIKYRITYLRQIDEIVDEDIEKFMEQLCLPALSD